MKTLKEISEILSDTYFKDFDKNKDHNSAKMVAINAVQMVDIRCFNPIAIHEFSSIIDKAYRQNLIN